MIGSAVQRLIELEVDCPRGGDHGRRTPGRINHGTGDRDRLRDTPADSIDARRRRAASFSKCGSMTKRVLISMRYSISFKVGVGIHQGQPRPICSGAPGEPLDIPGFERDGTLFLLVSFAGRD